MWKIQKIGFRRNKTNRKGKKEDLFFNKQQARILKEENVTGKY